MSSAVAVDVDGSVAIVRLQRPEVHNAFDPGMASALVDAIEQLSDDPAVRALVLQGGDRAFSTGDDIRVAADMDPVQFRDQVLQFQRLATALRRAPQPVVAAVAGYAYGGGLEIAVNCDARIAADNARFACPEVKWGLTLTNGSSVLLRRLVGDGWARELLLFGAVVDAGTAARIGLVTRLVPADALEEQALRMAQTASEFSADAMRATKTLLNDEYTTWEGVIDAETAAVVDAFSSDQASARLQSFVSGTAKAR